MQSKCKTCKKEFRHKPSKERLFCSMPCYRLSRRGIPISEPFIISCKHCGKDFVARRWHVLNRGKKYCSRSCASNYPTYGMSGKKHSAKTIKKLSISHVGKTGEKSSNWKGGMWRKGSESKENKGERIRFRETIQKQVLLRDNFTCQLCGVRGVALQVDHIQPWAEYVELRFNINNCRTLCQKCHYKITFGKEMPNNVRAWGHNLKHIIERMVS